MTATLAIITGWLHLGTGAAYLGVGLMSAIDVVRSWRRRGGLPFTEPERFGVGLILMASSCGPHHLEVGYHLLALTDPARLRGYPIDLVTILAALPFGAIFVWTRIEALAGSAERTVPTWIGAVAFPALLVYTALVSGTLVQQLVDRGPHSETWAAWVPQFILLVLYGLIGVFMWQGMARRVRATGQWPLGNFALAHVFPTCGLSHAVFGTAVALSLYEPDLHFALIDWYGVPVAMWFCYLTIRGRVLGVTVPDAA